MKLIKQSSILKGIIAILAIFSFLMPMQPAFAQQLQKTSRWSKLVSPSLVIVGGLVFGETQSRDIRYIVVQIIRVLLSLLGLICLILIILAGFKWMNSQGNTTKIGEAQKTIQAVVIGLLIIFASYGITLYVGKLIIEATSNSTGVNGTGNTVIK